MTTETAAPVLSFFWEGKTYTGTAAELRNYLRLVARLDGMIPGQREALRKAIRAALEAEEKDV